jgi:hypothetical protein
MNTNTTSNVGGVPLKKYKLPVTWEMSGMVEVEAASLEDAVKNFDPHEHELPDKDESEYVDSSFRLSDDDVENLKLYQR